jgi:hypothetical protein
MVIPFRGNLPLLRATQEALMIDTCQVTRLGVLVAWPRTGATSVPCRLGEERTFAEPADPYDANIRSLSEWALTLPWDMVVVESDKLSVPAKALELIAGDTNQPQTDLIALRVYATKPKAAVQWVSLTLYRDTDKDGIWSPIPLQTVQVFFDRVEPLEVPLRYSPAARTRYQGGRFAKEPPFNVLKDDSFKLNGFSGVITDVLPNQPQRIEARFRLDLGGRA